MMANPIPVVIDFQKTYEELEEVKIVQPKPSPRPSPTLDPHLEKIKDEKDEIAVEEEQKPKPLEPEVVVPPADVLPPDPLKDLAALDRLSVLRRLRVKDVITLKGKKNKFFVRTAQREVVYTIEEDNSWWVGYFCYGLRPLQLRVKNNQGSEVMRISRPYNFTTRFMPCQLQRIQVYSPPDQLIGTVMQKWAPIRPIYIVKDPIGSVVFTVSGPRITVSCCQDVQFYVRRPNGALVAATNKRWEGVIHALFFAPVKDQFGMTFFEKEMKGEEKALLLATALLLDYMYYDV